MRTFPNPRRTLTRAQVLSVAAHLLVLAAIFTAARFAPYVAPMRLPGTATGTHLLPVYSLGGPTGTLAEAKPAAAPRTKAPALAAPTPVPAPQPSAAAADVGTGDAGNAAQGDGNVNIALVRNHPHPEPDLSTLPHGTHGDVMLSIVIDATGRITDIKLDHGIAPAIDNAVIATVQQWSFAPATRNGQPVSSEQELLFHYERS